MTIRVIASFIAYVSMIALARWMGGSEYGAFTYVLTWIFVLALPAGLGLPVASVRFLPEYAAAGAWSRVRGLIGRSISLTILASVLVAVIAIGAIMLGGDRVPAAYRVPLLIALVNLPVFTLMALGSQIGRAFGWIVSAYAPGQIYHSLTLLIFAAGFMFAGLTLTARTLIIASIVIGALCVIGQSLVYARRLRPQLRNHPPEHEQRAWLRVAGPLLLIDAFGALIMYSDILMIGLFLDPALVAYYAAAARTAALVTFFFTAISALTGPKIAELYSQGRHDEVQALLRGIAPWIALPATAVTIALLAGGSLLLPLFGEGFEAGWVALILLSIGNLVMSINGPAATLLNMTGHQDTTAKIYFVATLANIGLNAILIPRFGIAGAAVATSVSTGAMSSYLVFVAHRMLGIRTILSFRRAAGT